LAIDNIQSSKKIMDPSVLTPWRKAHSFQKGRENQEEQRIYVNILDVGETGHRKKGNS